MSQVEQMKMQLHGLADQSRQGASSLGFKQRFEQSSQHVRALIRGSATGADRDISAVLEAAGKSVEQAVEGSILQRLAAAVTRIRSSRLRRPTCLPGSDGWPNSCSPHWMRFGRHAA
ncbi:MAG: hypothetical protein QOG10_4444 [Kribbellaceae bacterium]|jgi:hypothetical protein|nr:hypothetical protein [Kribbellaceae bacterium]